MTADAIILGANCREGFCCFISLKIYYLSLFQANELRASYEYHFINVTSMYVIRPKSLATFLFCKEG